MEIIACDIRKDEGLRYRKEKEILPCITAHINKNGGGNYCCLIIEKEREMRKEGDFANVRIRKLTPKECWRIRLMGFTDEDYEKAEKVCSDTRLYQQAGNSIVVQVLEGIFRNLM